MSEEDWRLFLQATGARKRDTSDGTQWCSRERPPDAPPPPPLTDDEVLERERTFLRKQGLMLAVSSLGDEYLAAITHLPTGRRVPIYARGSSAGAAAAAATARFRLETEE